MLLFENNYAWKESSYVYLHVKTNFNKDSLSTASSCDMALMCNEFHGTGGTGNPLDALADAINILSDETAKCHKCNGSGECTTCNGTGEV